MRWTMVLVIVTACGSKSTTGSIDASGIDAVVTGTDARAGIDGAAGVVGCGTAIQPTTCTLPGQACCDFAPGTGTDYCYDVTGGICEGGQPITCDGPEDCGSNERCCYKSPGGSTCTAGPDCAPGGSGGQVMCHVGDDAPCAPNGRCCPLHVGPSGAPLGACRVGACPG